MPNIERYCRLKVQSTVVPHRFAVQYMWIQLLTDFSWKGTPSYSPKFRIFADVSAPHIQVCSQSWSCIYLLEVLIGYTRKSRSKEDCKHKAVCTEHNDEYKGKYD